MIWRVDVCGAEKLTRRGVLPLPVVNDPLIPQTAKDAPLLGMEAAAGVDVVDQIKGHASKL